MSNRRKLALALLALVIQAGTGASSMAGYVAMAGNIHVIDAPASLSKGATTSDSQVATFAEKQGVTLTSDLNVDASKAGSVFSYGDLSHGTILAGTTVDSYFFHADPTSGSGVYDGSVTFGSKIIGVMVLDAGLDATDAGFGSPDTLYPTGLANRGLELNPISDYFNISADQDTFTLHLSTTTAVDQIRIFTAPSVTPFVTPEPTSAVLMGLGGACSIGIVRFRRKRAA